MRASRFWPAAGVLAFITALGFVAATRAADDAKSPTPQWLWTSKEPKANETVLFRKTIEVKPGLSSASLAVTCDNWVAVQVNRDQVVQHATWEQPLREDVTKRLKPGENTV
ncbi:MAG: hypothetical protein WBC44_17495, partial [Planctomycetaceae bacterium]